MQTQRALGVLKHLLSYSQETRWTLEMHCRSGYFRFNVNGNVADEIKKKINLDSYLRLHKSNTDNQFTYTSLIYDIQIRIATEHSIPE